MILRKIVNEKKPELARIALAFFIDVLILISHTANSLP